MSMWSFLHYTSKFLPPSVRLRLLEINIVCSHALWVVANHYKPLACRIWWPTTICTHCPTHTQHANLANILGIHLSLLHLLTTLDLWKTIVSSKLLIMLRDESQTVCYIADTSLINLHVLHEHLLQCYKVYTLIARSIAITLGWSIMFEDINY